MSTPDESLPAGAAAREGCRAWVPETAALAAPPQLGLPFPWAVHMARLDAVYRRQSRRRASCGKRTGIYRIPDEVRSVLRVDS